MNQIEIKKSTKVNTFKDLHIGDVFCVGKDINQNNIYVRIPKTKSITESQSNNSIRLSDGNFWNFTDILPRMNSGGSPNLNLLN